MFFLNPQAEHLLPSPLCLPQRFTLLLLAKFMLQYNCLFIHFSSLRSYEFVKHKLWHLQRSILSTQQRLAPYKMISKHIKNYILTSYLVLSLLFCPVSYCYFIFQFAKMLCLFQVFILNVIDNFQRNLKTELLPQGFNFRFFKCIYKKSDCNKIKFISTIRKSGFNFQEC